MDARLALLTTMDKGIPQGDVFRLALLHAVAELGGLGGAVHLRGPMSALRLVSSIGLPPALTRPWDIVAQDGPAAPARAVRRGRGVWVPAALAEPWPGTGLAAAPVFGGRRTVGSLTVLMDARGGPTREQWDFLRAVTGWVEDRMGQAPPPSRPHRIERSRGLREALDEVRVGSWEWNIRTGELTWDEAAMALYGTEAADFVPRIESWMRVVHPDDLPGTLAAAEKAIRNRDVFEAEYRVRRPDGGYRWTQARGKVVLDDAGEPVRMVGVGWDSNESPSARNALSRALRHMSDGFLSVDGDWRIVFVNLEAERTLGSSEEELIGRTLWELPAVQRVPGLEARCREAGAGGVPGGFDIELPTTGRWYHLRLVPVPDGMTCYLTDVTEKRQRAARRRAAAQAEAERASHIAELTTALAAVSTTRDVVDAAAARVLPMFGAAGLIVKAVEGNRLYSVRGSGYTREFLERLNRPDTETGPLAEAMHDGAPRFISSLEEFSERYPHLTALPTETGTRAWAVLPLTASERPFGAWVISFSHSRRLTGEERSLLTAISGLVAQALERARLYDAEHHRAQELQRGLLPRALPEAPACTTAARYLPGGRGTEVGGDWYDVIPLSAARIALVVGDVMGHGLPEAITMARLRTAVRTLADVELPPDEIMGQLNDIIGDLGDDCYATCLYALYDPTSGLCSFVRAGHLPLAVVRPDGTVHFAGSAPDPPLGAADPPFETVEMAIPEESLLVLYTNGLVDAARHGVDEGMADLARILSAAGGRDEAGLSQLCDRLTAGLLPAEHHSIDDDAALLVARVHRVAADRMASWPLPDDPRAAGEARRHIREQLAAWGLDSLLATTELLASELIGNVVRHAKGPLRLRLLQTTSLICEVFDGSQTMPRIRRAAETEESGRGLQLIAALAQRWGTRYTATGKCIWTEQELPGPDGRLSDDAALAALGTWDFDDQVAFPSLEGDGRQDTVDDRRTAP
ncbi:SpoIIE family protein phosphatase [Streptomyces sp. CoH17]|uniref:SpoIIE family protein phosphatase n=1 Tax=Streptomyces sp. CoH17 TaxID=2992806 RepID=UPI00226DBA2C|nr:SpoIIE family protein phosphatase [Streptomyces sp. CoH17]